MELHAVTVDKPDECNVIVGQSHFIKTVEDLHEALVGVGGKLRFGIAFCEASGPCLVRRSGNDDDLVELATRNALAVAAGHVFFVFLRDGYPVNVLNQIKQVPEVCRIFCATANPLEILVAETGSGREWWGSSTARRRRASRPTRTSPLGRACCARSATSSRRWCR